MERRLKVVVYAIAKDEEKFAERWMHSMREADEVVVLDTGSTDGTREILRRKGAKVFSESIVPWRFDAARNASMKLIPADADICVCTDLDEIFVRGWRRNLEDAWRAALDREIKPTTARYEYVWSFNPDGSDDRKFAYEKIHAPGVCKWTHPCHEVLDYSVPKVCVDAQLRLEHHADPKKSRWSYLALLKTSVEEDPDDDRNAHYYARELMFNRRWDEAVAEFKRHLALPRAVWKPERAASMRFIAKCLLDWRGDYNGAADWLRKAIDEYPQGREAAVELAEAAYARKDWRIVVLACRAALKVTVRDGSYLSTAKAWGALPWDLYSLGLWYTGDRVNARGAVAKAVALDPANERLRANQRIMGG